MLWKFILAVVVWIVVAIVLEIVGDLLGGNIGDWLASNNVLIGFLCGVLYFFFGSDWTPARRV